ncbi:hypothetical protein FRB93_003235 [Tulasnella sp. JGI-2019a]|nr:hypothetical protein FRB93_003235 [Tulasnella sp. JGI-2019a]
MLISLQISPSSDRVLDKETDTIKITPISVLPEDVLIEVIGIVSHPQGDQHPHDYVKRLHTMVQVCASWASIILHTPSLWSAIRFDADFGGTGWVTALRRSQHCRIAVECQSRTSPEPFWSTIVTHSHRWASLTVIVLQRSKWVRFTGVRAPFLKELRLSMSGEQSISTSTFSPTIARHACGKPAPRGSTHPLNGFRCRQRIYPMAPDFTPRTP